MPCDRRKPLKFKGENNKTVVRPSMVYGSYGAEIWLTMIYCDETSATTKKENRLRVNGC